jgi:hypothetical protein
MDHVLEWIEDEQWDTALPRKAVPVFLRFGKFSRYERSFNFATGEYEKGISVYPAKITEDGVVLDDSEYRWMWIRINDMRDNDGVSLFNGRCVFVLTGKEVAKGSDGEPLLRPSSIRVLPYTVAFDKIRELVGKAADR